MFFANKILFCCAAAGSLALGSCKKFVDIGAPATQIGVQEAFQSESSATSAIIGLYSTGFATNLTINYTGLCGSSADDIRYAVNDPNYGQFANDALLSSNTLVPGLWSDSYSQILQANLAIGNLNATTALSPAVKSQLLGEARTWRALVYFYLVNLYGDVPLELTTDVASNGAMGRTAAAAVWSQVIADLQGAVGLLQSGDPTGKRARINQYAAMALLAKAYLYTQDWKDAEQTASGVIGSGVFSLGSDLNSVFVNTSNEVIWQIATTTGVSVFGSNFLAPKGVLPAYVLYDTLYHSFEPGDLRKKYWTTSDTLGGTPYYYDFKDKVRSGTGSEYNVVLRLAEQYLIRAEARAQQGNLSGATDDVNVIRTRAGLSLLGTGLSKAAVLAAVEQERKVELFGEWGNRWLDLKRTPGVLGGATRADEVLGGGLKPAWKHDAVLYPIPAAQIIANPALKQNAGY